MNRILVAVCGLALAVTSTAEAQYRSARPVRAAERERRYEVSVFGGYQFGGSLDVVLNGTTPGRLSIGDHGNYGMAFDVRVRPGVLGEFLYLRQPTTLYFQPVNGVKTELFPAHVVYYQLGGLYEVPRGRVRPFGSLSFGITHFNPKQSGTSSEVRFAMTAGLGFRAFLNDRIGVRGQVHLLLPFQWYGGGIFCGGGGCSVGVSSGSAIVQGQVSGGLVVAL
jgi:hypothetical protein